MQRFTVTYEIVTPESAEYGDIEKRGFVLPGGWNVTIKSALDDEHGTYDFDLRAALNLCSPDCDRGQWFDESDGRHDYRTGAIERRSLHPPRNITTASYARLKRLLGVH